MCPVQEGCAQGTGGLCPGYRLSRISLTTVTWSSPCLRYSTPDHYTTPHYTTLHFTSPHHTTPSYPGHSSYSWSSIQIRNFGLKNNLICVYSHLKFTKTVLINCLKHLKWSSSELHKAEVKWSEVIFYWKKWSFHDLEVLCQFVLSYGSLGLYYIVLLFSLGQQFIATKRSS